MYLCLVVSDVATILLLSTVDIMKLKTMCVHNISANYRLLSLLTILNNLTLTHSGVKGVQQCKSFALSHSSSILFCPCWYDGKSSSDWLKYAKEVLWYDHMICWQYQDRWYLFPCFDQILGDDASLEFL